MGVPADALQASIDAYNAAVETGFDAEFGRIPTTKLEAPFVALAVTPCVIITYGGIARNADSEVIRADGTVDYNNVYLASFAPRPAFNLKSSIVVSDSKDSDGCYTVESVPGNDGGLYVKNNGLWVRAV